MPTANCWGDATVYDFAAISAALFRYLKLKTHAVGMKRYASVEEMLAIPRIRRPSEKLATDQVVAQARWIGWTLGITATDLMGQQCAAVVGLVPRDREFLSGERMRGVWYGTLEDSAAHQAAMSCAPYGDYAALAVSPMTSGRLDNPDICLVYATPGQMITLINGLQYEGYRRYSFTAVGESACADSWGRALASGEPCVSIPCYAERKFGGVQDDELLIALPPSYLPKLVEGLAALDRNGLRYPIASHGIQKSPLDSIAASYGAAAP
jgi:uncharacterized protein (DUF169 family)